MEKIKIENEIAGLKYKIRKDLGFELAEIKLCLEKTPNIPMAMYRIIRCIEYLDNLK